MSAILLITLNSLFIKESIAIIIGERAKFDFFLARNDFFGIFFSHQQVVRLYLLAVYFNFHSFVVLVAGARIELAPAGH